MKMRSSGDSARSWRRPRKGGDIFKKSVGRVLSSHTLMFECIKEQSGRYQVRSVCRALDVSRSGYYAWQDERPTPRQQANRLLMAQIVGIRRQI